LFFVADSEGKRVRLEESDEEQNKLFVVPNIPVSSDGAWK